MNMKFRTMSIKDFNKQCDTTLKSNMSFADAVDNIDRNNNNYFYVSMCENDVLDAIETEKELAEQLDNYNKVENEIMQKINSIENKYYEYNKYLRIFLEDYLPIANNDEDMAMKFLIKAYTITNEQKEYILNNYKVK